MNIRKPAREIDLLLSGELPDSWDADLPEFPPDDKGIATREASGKVINAIGERVPWLIGGAGDLSPSTKTNFTFKGAGELEPDDPGGRTMHFGIREHAMGAIVNGLGVSKLRAFGATFLTFSDYMRPSIRLAALMKLPIFHVFTHDSIGLGEDGPTHQPIEQLVALRAIPNLIVLRPADANEVREAYKVIFGLSDEPACLVLSRQKLPVFDRSRYAPASGLARGAYVMADADDGDPEVILIATGSEVALCIEAREQLQRKGIAARVVSMPSWELFERQDETYRNEVLPPRIMARVAVEMGSVIGWDRYAGLGGAIIGMHSFGASAPIKDLMPKFGFVADKVVAAAESQIARNDAIMNPLKSLADHGQAVWLDFLSRGFMAKGGLKKLVDNDGLRGMTSNPSIFEQAIGHSDEYDDAIGRMLSAQDRSVGEIFEHLAIEDIKQATDMLASGVSTPRHGADGFVSIEVSPYLAKDTQGTIDEAKRLWREVGRKNLMIKVPGNAGGPAGDPRTDRRGHQRQHHAVCSRSKSMSRLSRPICPVSRRWRKKAATYRTSPALRASSSAASTPPSTSCSTRKSPHANDPDEKIRLKALKGKIAIANAKMAYQRYKRLFSGERWEALAAKGAKAAAAAVGLDRHQEQGLQRRALCRGIDRPRHRQHHADRDHGCVSRPRQGARQRLKTTSPTRSGRLSDLGRAGISLDAVTDKLVEEGVRLFADAADKLLGAVAEKRAKALGGGIDEQKLALGDALTKKVDTAAEDWRAHGNVRKLWQRDKSLWTGADEDKWLGWLDSPDADQLRSYAVFAEEIKREGFPGRAFCSAWVVRASGPKCWPRRSATSPAGRGCAFSIPPCRRRSRRSMARSIWPRRCSSYRASRAAPRSRMSSRIIFSSGSRTPSAKPKPAGNSSPSPIPDRRWRKRRRRKISAKYSSVCRASAAVTRCCRRSAWCRRQSRASTSCD